jgi:hypothetical protein
MSQSTNRFTRENTPGVDDRTLAVLNDRYETAARHIDRAHVDPAFFEKLAVVILEDYEANRKVAQAFTTYLAKGNREDLA